MTVHDVRGATVAVISAGYEGKRRALTRMHDLGARLVIVDEPGHWSEALVAEGVAAAWVAAPVVGDADTDAAAVLEALDREGIRPDGVLTFWENSICVAARVATALGLPTNPPAAVDAARSKLRTRELSTELGIPSPVARRVRSLDELFAAAAVVGFPAVVKPEFGAAAVGCVRVDSMDSLPGIYSLVRSVVTTDTDDIFRTGNDLLLEQYLDGVEFDVDLVMQDGQCAFASVSQNWPTAEPSFQETGLHCPPDHDKKDVQRLVDLTVRTAQAFGLRRGVLHVEGKCTSRGPRIIEVNARMGGARIHEIVEAVWGVDLIEAHLRSCLDLPCTVRPSKKPRAAVVNTIVHARTPGRLQELMFHRPTSPDCLRVEIDVEAEVGDEVQGPEHVFASVLAEITLTATDPKRARALSAELIRTPPVIV